MTLPTPGPHPSQRASGGVITEIRPLAGDPSRREVLVGGRVVAALRPADVEDHGLEVGRTWSEDLADAVAGTMAVLKARQVALTLLGRRGYSAGEVRDRLRRRGFEPPAVDRAVEELERDGWIDDEAYARALAESWLDRDAATADFIVHRLRCRHVPDEIAERVAREIVASIDMLDAATDLARRRRAAMGQVTPGTAARRIAAALARRGFDEETVAAVLARLELPARGPQGP